MAAAATVVPPTLENAEKVHVCFRGSNELAKRFLQAALLFDAVAVTATLTGIFRPHWAGWTALLITLLAVAGVGVRQYAASLRSYALGCRRFSMRAFCSDVDLSGELTAELVDCRPGGTDRRAAKLPARSLAQYYLPDPTNPIAPGDTRKRVCCAYSAYFTSHQLKYASWGLFVIAALFFALGCIIIYQMALQPGPAPPAPQPGASGSPAPGSNPSPTDARLHLLSAICTVVFVFFSLRALSAGLTCINSAGKYRRILGAMTTQPRVSGERLEELLDEYDFQRIQHPEVPTFLYLAARTRLEQGWREYSRTCGATG